MGRLMTGADVARLKGKAKRTHLERFTLAHKATCGFVLEVACPECLAQTNEPCRTVGDA